MEPYLACAAALAVLVGLVHSVLGEILIFRRAASIQAGGNRHPRPFGILWATWHIATVMGWALAVVLWKLAAMHDPSPLRDFLLLVIAITYAVSGLLVVIGTRARHPGWAGLFGVAVLVWLA
ncbi:MAG: hypothetical protein AMXMBFR59_07660 [Rhodanobacteraceae bacterium]